MEDLLPLLLGAAYLVMRAIAASRKKKRQQARPQPVDPQTGQPAGPTPFEQLLQQIEDAMEEQAEPRRIEPEPVRETDPVPASPVPFEPVPAAPIETDPARPGSFDSTDGFALEAQFEQARVAPSEARAFTPGNPFSEEAFERLERGLDITEHADGHLDHGRTPARPKPRRRDARGPEHWRRILRSPESAKDALVLTEIFRGPWEPRTNSRR